MESNMRPESQIVHRLSKWARCIVLIETGEPVDLVHVEEFDGESRAFIELPSGIRTYVPEAALTNRLARLGDSSLTLASVAIAGVLLGYTLGLAPADNLASTQETSPRVQSVDG
jgi:hypothetical protein